MADRLTAAVEIMDAFGDLPGGPPAAAAVDDLLAHLPLRGRIEEFWLDPAQQRAASWTAHQDINAVMLATSLVPDGYLG